MKIGNGSEGQLVRPRTLVVEDDLSYGELLCKTVEKVWGGFAIAVEDGFSAYDLLSVNRDRVDLVLCDLRIPKFDGFRLLRNLREDGDWFGRFVVVTNMPSKDVEMFASKLNVYGVIYKNKIVNSEFKQVFSKVCGVVPVDEVFNGRYI